MTGQPHVPPWERLYDHELITAALAGADATVSGGDLDEALAALLRVLPPDLTMYCPHESMVTFALDPESGLTDTPYVTAEAPSCAECIERLGDDAACFAILDFDGVPTMLGAGLSTGGVLERVGVLSRSEWQERALALGPVLSSVAELVRSRAAVQGAARDAALALLHPTARTIAEQVVDGEESVGAATLYSASIAAAT